jgi:hypothetical protein
VEQVGAIRGEPDRGSRAAGADREGNRERWSTVAAGRRHPVDPERLLGAEPRRQAPGRRRDWRAAQAALERLAGWGRHRDYRDQPHPGRADRDRLGRTVGRQERDGR